MFVRCSLETSLELGELGEQSLAWLTSGFQSVTRDVRSQTSLSHADLASKVGIGPGSLRFEVEDALVDESIISIPFRVWDDGFEESWPSFRGAVTAVGLGRRLTQLELTGQYELPDGLEPGKQLVVQHAVEARGRRFLIGVATEMSKRQGSPVIR